MFSYSVIEGTDSCFLNRKKYFKNNLNDKDGYLIIYSLPLQEKTNDGCM